MRWRDASEDNPGYVVEEVQAGDRLYRIQAKKGMGVWRLFVRDSDSEPLRTIYVGEDMASCKAYGDAYEALQGE